MRLTPRRCLEAALPTLLGVIAVGMAPAAAQMRIDAVPESVLRPYSVRDSGASLGSESISRSAHTLATAAAPRPRDYSWLGGALQVEGARVKADGTYSRPRIMIGVPSESMKDWMNSAGLTAEQCMLPMVRARARVNADGEASGAMWLYARCTFQ